MSGFVFLTCTFYRIGMHLFVIFKCYSIHLHILLFFFFFCSTLKPQLVERKKHFGCCILLSLILFGSCCVVSLSVGLGVACGVYHRCG